MDYLLVYFGTEVSSGEVEFFCIFFLASGRYYFLRYFFKIILKF